MERHAAATAQAPEGSGRQAARQAAQVQVTFV